MPMIDVYATAGTFADKHQLAKDLAAKGVEFKHGPEKQVWGGTMAQFYDVDKNGFVLVQMPQGG